MNTKTILIALAAIAVPAAATAGDPRCRTYQPRPICRVVPRPICRAPVYQPRQPTCVPRYSSGGYAGQRSYGYSGQSSLGSVSYHLTTPYAYTSPSSYSASGGSSSLGGFKIVQGSGQYVPHANGGHYNSSIRLVPTR